MDSDGVAMWYGPVYGPVNQQAVKRDLALLRTKKREILRELKALRGRDLDAEGHLRVQGLVRRREAITGLITQITRLGAARSETGRAGTRMGYDWERHRTYTLPKADQDALDAECPPITARPEFRALFA